MPQDPGPVDAGVAGCGGGTGSGGWAGSSATGGGTGTASIAPGGGDGGVPAGTLTAGTWDDNVSFASYQHFVSTTQAVAIVDATARVLVRVHDVAGVPVPGASVQFATASGPVTTLTGTDGVALFFPSWDGTGAASVTVTSGNQSLTQPVTGDLDFTVSDSSVPVDTLELALVLDTTGSMGDELRWITNEVDSISATIAARYPHVTQRWGLVLYRDEGDDYVTRVTDFTSLADFRAALATASAGGGGDFPEAVDQAMAAAAGLSWHGGATARMVFHVADAPQHDDKGPQVAAALSGLRGQGVHYYPVAASGVDSLFELTFRTIALTTGGRYVFLTDDSGIGDSHAEPTIPCYFVTRLESALVRMVDIELSGQPHAPAASEIIRAVGDLQQCDPF